MANTRDVHGHKVDYEDEGKRGVEFLDDRLDYKEAEVFFRDAKSRGSVEFEDQDGRDYTLSYDQSHGRYAVARRKTASSWF